MQPIHLTKPQEAFLKSIYNKIHSLKTKSREKIEIPVSLDIVKTNPVYQYIPPTIQSWIAGHKDHQLYYKKISLQIAHRQIVIHIVSFSQNSEKKYQKIVHLIKMWLEIASQYAASNCAEQLDIYLYLTPFKKELPAMDETGDHLDEMHINTASTTSCMLSNSILIYRREEWFKVFIHETFHCMGLDFSDQDNAKVDKKILELYPGCDPSLDVRFYETYCETWATIINILFVMAYPVSRAMTTRIQGGSREKTRRQKMIPKKWNMREFVFYLNKERKYTMKQAAKILHYHNIRYRQLIGLEEIETKYREKTQIFAYYVLKSVVFFSIDEFWKWVEEVSQFSLDFPKKQGAEEKMDEFYKIIERNYKREEFIEELEEAKTNSLSMKMTVYGDVLSK